MESPSLRPLALANQSQSHCWLEHFARSLRAHWLPAAAGSLVAQLLAATAAAAKATWARSEFAARFPPRKEVKAIIPLFSGTQTQGVASEPAWIIAGWNAMSTLSGKRVPGDSSCRLGVSVSVTNPGPCGLPGRPHHYPPWPHPGSGWLRQPTLARSDRSLSEMRIIFNTAGKKTARAYLGWKCLLTPLGCACFKGWQAVCYCGIL